MLETAARAENSCKRCHRRKKRCDKILPQCQACQHAKVACSFLDDESQVASYPIAYGSPLQFHMSEILTRCSYVRGLERRVKELEQRLAASLAHQASHKEPSSCTWDENADIRLAGLQDNFLTSANVSNLSPNRALQSSDRNTISDYEPLSVTPTNAVVSNPRKDPLVDELRLLSLEAAAERYLGSSSGLSLAKLTQTVLQRLSPDQDGFVFDGESDDSQSQNYSSTIDPYSGLNPILFEMNPSPTSPLSLDSLYDNPVVEGFEDSTSLALLEPSHINCILEFYFAHSHTLYPIIPKTEFETVLWRVYDNPLEPFAQSPLWQFRIWMVLAIGATTYCSVSLMEETEPVQLFNKAMTYFESAMGCGDLVGILSTKCDLGTQGC